MRVTGPDQGVLLEACRTVVAAGMTPVNTEANQRLRAWLDLNEYWPPKDWQPDEQL